MKKKIQKNSLLLKIRRNAEKIYCDSWQRDGQVETYVRGAEAAINEIQKQLDKK